MSDDVEQIVATLEKFQAEAIQAIDQTNVEDFDTPADVYEGLSRLDPKSYEIEIELTEYELVQLTDTLTEPMERASRANEIVYSTEVLRKLLEAAPEHVERINEIGEDVEQPPRGFQ